MASQQNASVRELTRESEVTREAFVRTVGQLKEGVSETIDDIKARVSPSNVKAEIKQYVREESSDILSAIERKARENPLQAVAIGAGLLYPLWGLLRAIPVPLLLIGGGVWLSKQNPNDVKAAVAQGTRGAARSAREAEVSLADGVENVTQAVGDTANKIMGATEEAVAAFKTEAVDAAETVSNKATQLGELGVNAAHEARTSFDGIIERNPLLVGGIALAIGAFIAASLPGTEIEDKLFGDHSDDIKNKASQVVAEGVERAKGAAADAVGEISAAAAREGLNSEALSKSVEGAAAAVKAVVDKGLTTALGAGSGKSTAEYR
jgi:ElaB/YqjD/DUF883 family membrane-anchored ribosome-binding protein